MKKLKGSLHFLIIEDVKEHALLIREAVHAHDFLHDITSLRNCHRAIDLMEEYLREDYLPHIIILDLNSGGPDARIFLKEISSRKEFMKIPIIVLSALASKDDQAFVNGLPNAFFINKPAGIMEFMNLMNFICNFWSENKKVPDYGSLKKRLTSLSS